MNKIKVVTIGIILVIVGYRCQGQDVRGTKWGMTLEEVIKAEYPLEYDNYEKGVQAIKGGKVFYGSPTLIYENVAIDGRNVRVSYEFENNKLIKVTFRFKYDGYNYGQTSLSNRFSLMNSIIETLIEKEFFYNSCWMDHPYGWTHYGQEKKCLEAVECKITDEALKQVQFCLDSYNLESVGIRFKDERTHLSLCFPSKRHSFYDEIIGWVWFSPTYEVEKTFKKSGGF